MVEGPGDSVNVPDGAALSAFQYFENVRNFLDAVEELGLPTFEVSDLEEVCILVLLTSVERPSRKFCMMGITRTSPFFSINV